MYKVNNDMVPTYISDLITPTFGETNQYPLRNTDNLRGLNVRTTVSQKSCLPSRVNMWNSLDLNIRNSTSFSAFKREVLKEHTPKPVPSFNVSGSRFYSVIHARIRTNCSDLNIFFFCTHLRLNPYCACTTEREDAEHYFFLCKSYENQRMFYL